MAKRYSKAAHAKRHKQTSHKIKNVIILIFCGAAIWFCCSLWYAARTLQTAHPAESIAGEVFRPQVGDPPYRAATAAELIRLLQQDANFIPLQTRNSFDETATPAQRAARASEQSPQLLLSIHGNSAANGSTASGFECYPSVPGRTWHQESFYFAQLLAEGMQASGAALRGHGGVRYIYYLENDQKQLVESTHTEIREERSFTLLEDVNCPAVLAEQCFVTNEADAARFGSEEGCKKAARIYYEAICEYFGTQPQSEQLAGLSLN